MLDKNNLEVQLWVEEFREKLVGADVVFGFDIDNTLSVGQLRTQYKDCPKYLELKEEQYKSYTSELGFLINPYDFREPHRECLEQFASLLKETNGVAVCVSSWVMSLNARSSNEVAVKSVPEMIDDIFAFEFGCWPKGKVVGGLICGDINRGVDLKDALSSIGVEKPLVVIDDAAHRYTDKRYAYNVDGRTGLTKSDVENIKQMLKV